MSKKNLQPAPEKNVNLIARVTRDQQETLARLADENGTSVSVLVRIAIRALTLGTINYDETDILRESRPAPRRIKKAL